MASMAKIGLVDVGGGLRGIYGAGVLDRAIEDGVHFDFCIGVSAGSANTASYLAGQKGRNYRFYTEYAARKDYMSFHNYMKTGSYLGLSYIYGGLSNTDGEDPLDYDAIEANPAEWEIVSTEAHTGAVHYFTKADMKKDDYFPLMASCCIPVVNRPVERDGIAYFDGGLADAIPLERAFARGCTHVVVVLTKPPMPLPASKQDAFLAKLVRKQYPETAKRCLDRTAQYNRTLALAKAYEKSGEVLIVAPKDIGALKTLTRDKAALDRLYRQGYADGEAIRGFIASAVCAD